MAICPYSLLYGGPGSWVYSALDCDTVPPTPVSQTILWTGFDPIPYEDLGCTGDDYYCEPGSSDSVELVDYTLGKGENCFFVPPDRPGKLLVTVCDSTVKGIVHRVGFWRCQRGEEGAKLHYVSGAYPKYGIKANSGDPSMVSVHMNLYRRDQYILFRS